jgi:L-amino acid N-acyltransferase YncA
MVGKTWGVDTDQIDVSDLETNPDSGIDLGEIAPRYWVPIVIGNKAPKTFWHEQVTSEKPKPYDDDDLEGAKPWWELYQSRGSAILKPWIHPEIEGVDPNETRDERLARENDSGSNFHTENRKKKEKAKKDADREKKKLAQEKAQKMHKSSSKIDAPAVSIPFPDPDPIVANSKQRIKTDVSLYIRGATVQDIPAIREIYNHYVTFSVSTPEIERRTDRDMLSRLKEVRDNKLPFLVACERGQKIGGRGRKKGREDPIILPDKVVGFAFADDYNDMVGMYRFTAEMEVYVDNHNYMKGIGKCLMDKLLGLLDPEHVERGGYDIVGDEAEGIGSSRMIKNLIINMSYDRPEILEWKGRWLTTGLGFKQVGDLQAIGHKDAKT